MAKLQGWRIGFVVFMLFAATVIAAPAQTFKTLASFDGTDGYNPVAGLVQGRDGNFYLFWHSLQDNPGWHTDLTLHFLYCKRVS
jgi:hypothetical protein